MSDKRNQPCKITITRPQSGDGRKRISICIIDEVSGVEFFDGDMTMEGFSEALTGLGRVPIIAELRLENVGKRMETKTINEQPEAL